MLSTTFFNMIKAPLKNPRWSWGAVRADGVVVLRVNTTDIHNGMARLTSDHQTNKHGRNERMEHIGRVMAGAPCYVVSYKSKKPDAVGDYIVDLDHRQLWFGTAIVEQDGNYYLKLTHRVALGELL